MKVAIPFSLLVGLAASAVVPQEPLAVGDVQQDWPDIFGGRYMSFRWGRRTWWTNFTQCAETELTWFNGIRKSYKAFWILESHSKYLILPLVTP